MSQAQIVMTTQKLLIKNRYLNGSADGELGSTTLEAVDAALEDSEINLTIYSDNGETLKALESVFLRPSGRCEPSTNTSTRRWSLCFDVN